MTDILTSFHIRLREVVFFSEGATEHETVDGIMWNNYLSTKHIDTAEGSNRNQTIVFYGISHKKILFPKMSEYFENKADLSNLK